VPDHGGVGAFSQREVCLAHHGVTVDPVKLIVWASNESVEGDHHLQDNPTHLIHLKSLEIASED
jgi:hypothetical protein